MWLHAACDLGAMDTIQILEIIVVVAVVVNLLNIMCSLLPKPTFQLWPYT